MKLYNQDLINLSDRNDLHLFEYNPDIDLGSTGISLRDYQSDIINEVIDKIDPNRRNLIVLNLPTGSGKSIIGMGLLCELLNKKLVDLENGGKGYVLTHLNNLTEQYESSIPFLTPIRGKSSYRCLVTNNEPEYKICSETKKFNYDTYSTVCQVCEHRRAKVKMRASRLILSNYNLYLYAWIDYNIGNDSKVLILDEAHNLINIIDSIANPDLTSTIEFLDKWHSIIRSRLLEMNDVDGDRPNKFLEYLRLFDSESFEGSVINKLLKSKNYRDIIPILDPIFNNNTIFSIDEAVSEDFLNKYLDYISLNLEIVDKDKNEWKEISNNLDLWGIIDELPVNKTLPNKKLVFDILHKCFTNKCKYTILLSATLPEELVRKYYLPEDTNLIYKSLDPIFPKKNRPTYLVPKLGKLNSKYFDSDENVIEWSNLIESIVSTMENKKGYIYCNSFSQVEKLRQKLLRSPLYERFIFNNKSTNTKSSIDRFLKSPQSILVSPNIKEGYDLKDDLSRFQIIAKLPYPKLDVADKYGWNYYRIEASNKLLQLLGRSVRSPDDYAVSFILDDSLGMLRSNLPKWFNEELITIG